MYTLEKIRNNDKYALAFLIIFYTVGILGFSFSFSRDLFNKLVPVNLLISSLIMFFYHKAWNRRFNLILVIIAVLGFLLEMIGVATGLVFGLYHYGDALGLKINGTPVMIALNWVMLIYATHMIVRWLKLNKVWRIILAALLMVIYDINLEPIASCLNMWAWSGGEIPLQNYIAWFVISIIMLLLLEKEKVQTVNKTGAYLFLVQFVFFLALHLILDCPGVKSTFFL